MRGPKLQPPDTRKHNRQARHPGTLLAGVTKREVYLFDWDIADRLGVRQVSCALPYADVLHLPERNRDRPVRKGVPLEFSHTVEDQMGGQLDAGFVLTGLFEDQDLGSTEEILARQMPVCIATRALKPECSP